MELVIILLEAFNVIDKRLFWQPISLHSIWSVFISTRVLENDGYEKKSKLYIHTNHCGNPIYVLLAVGVVTAISKSQDADAAKKGKSDRNGGNGGTSIISNTQKITCTNGACA